MNKKQTNQFIADHIRWRIGVMKDDIQAYEKTLPPPKASAAEVRAFEDERDDYTTGSVVYFTLYRELEMLHAIKDLFLLLALMQENPPKEVEKALEQLRREVKAERVNNKPVRKWYQKYESHMPKTEDGGRVP